MMDQQEARDLARIVGERAHAVGVSFKDMQDPGVGAVLARCQEREIDVCWMVPSIGGLSDAGRGDSVPDTRRAHILPTFGGQL